MKNKIIIFVLCFIYLILSISSALDGGDFDVYLDASIKLSNLKNIYAPPFVKDLQYYYSPLFALILVPFNSNFFITELIWLLLSGFWSFRTFILIQKYLNYQILLERDKKLILFISFFFILRFLLYEISMVQITIFLLWGIFESINLINNKKWILGSALLAFIINIKLMPLVIVPYLVYRFKFKSFISVVIISFALLFIPALFVGQSFNSFLLQEWWKVINPVNKEHLIEAGTNSQSLVGLIPVFLTETKGEMDFTRNFLSLRHDKAIQITNIVRLCLILFTVYFLKSPFVKQINKFSELRSIAYICLLVPLIFPHQQKYAFIFIYPMIIYLTYYSIILWKQDKSIKTKIYIYSLLFISIILSPLIGSDIVGRFNYDLIHHFRLLGFAAISLIFFAVLSNPSIIHNTEEVQT